MYYYIFLLKPYNFPSKTISRKCCFLISADFSFVYRRGGENKISQPSKL